VTEERVMGLVQRVRRLVSTDDPSDGAGDQARTTETTDPGDAVGAEESTASEERTTKLFHCDSCDVTLVSEELDSCPRCDGSVEKVPTEDDVGIV
jgi:hypothetical protein